VGPAGENRCRDRRDLSRGSRHVIVIRSTF
jgi:hypothetical protein